MITRAQVIRRVNQDDEYLWYVNIPILNGVPDNKKEAESYKRLLNVNIKNNDKLKAEMQRTKSQIAQVTDEQWGNSNSTDMRFTEQAYLPDFSSKTSEFVTQARLCGISGMANLIHPGDIVMVGFEDNDMGKPIILGHLLTKSLEQPGKSVQNHPVIKCSVLNASQEVILPFKTIFTTRSGAQLDMQDLMQLWDFYQSFTSSSAPGAPSLLDKIKSIIPKEENN